MAMLMRAKTTIGQSKRTRYSSRYRLAISEAIRTTAAPNAAWMGRTGWIARGRGGCTIGAVFAVHRRPSK
jgi:hypothetical protein